ncbi:MAG: O-antigen translocase [Rhodomicrobium sp.]
MTQNSYRTILRSSSIMGAASVANIVISLVRMKIVAVLLGPAGIGLVGLLCNLMQAGASVAAMGLGAVGVRQVAEAHGNGRHDDVAIARRALLWGTLVLAALGAAVVFLLREPIARLVLADAGQAGNVGWLAVGVALTVASGSQGALLNGMRRIGDLAWLQIASALLSSALGVGALLLWGGAGLTGFVLSAPLATFVLGHYFVARSGAVRAPPTPRRQVVAQWRIMIPLGAAFMISGLVTTGGFLVVRSLVRRELGAEELGYFQAAWAIGMTYLAFVLGAMGTDYYPRLSGCIGDPAAASRLVNEQTEVALLLTAPPLIAVLALSPWIVRLLYTNEFGPAVDILHWQLLGDLLKVMSWPLGFVMLAAGAGRTFIFSESIALAVYVGGVALGLALVGVVATGIAFLAMYAVLLPIVYWLARRRIGFRWTPSIVVHGAIFFGVACGVSAVSRWSEPMAAVIGLTAAGLIAPYALGRLGRMAELSGPVGHLAALARSSTERLGIRHG